MSQLPLEYSNALKGLKAHADYATKSLIDKYNDEAELTKALKLISENKIAVKKIIEAVKDEQVTIPEIDEAWLFDWLIRTGDLSLSFLWKRPLYYAACNKIEEIEYYFVTKYFNDVQACVGQSTIKEDVEEAMHLFRLEYIPDIPLVLKQSLKMPDIISHVATLKEL
ncbi:hypothetical protein [Photobacterium lutimaris]|uniref:Uncharacterized protein n=1 Tax=Photobacterium lutimaris TaxID=388278 RepID=A0A2T3ITQ6_9GAMM|nr:hypothetical protein [Photobacterium lutimaris]PSU31749.1 hypothetical protein C9I99_21430 [Photobacterium lutimaris]TDR72604.1 hypothetical protein DFP78_11380 [Photobacterium lutimaris]